MTRRRIALALLVLVATLVLALWTGDRRAPGAASTAGPDVALEGGVLRRDVRFACGDSDCAGWLYRPPGAGPFPGVVLGHGFSGTRDVGLATLAERLAADGFAALAFDYRHFGDSGGLPRQLVDPWTQLDDWRAARDWLGRLPDVDPERIALLGFSLGGGHALVVAAEGGVRAVVAQAPLVDSSVEGEAGFAGPLWAIRVLLSAWADLAFSAVGAGPLEVAAIAPRGGFGMIVDDHANAALARSVPAGSRYRNAVAARSMLTFDDYNPSRQASTISAPVLLIASRDDRFAPYASVEGFARGRDNVTVATFPGDHFDVYAPPAADTALAATRRFLREQLGGAASTAR